MEKPEQVLILDPPAELRFKGPFNAVVTVKLSLTNPSEQRVCFKVKTTAPKKYCVRPNCGIIEPKQSTELSVMLQPFDYNASERNKHKFLVLSCFAPEGELNLESIFKADDSSKLMDSKLKCVFELPAEDTENENPSAPPAYKEVSRQMPPLSGSGDLDVGKAGAEIQKLRDELSNLRQENIILKQESQKNKNLSKMSPSVAATNPDMPSSQTMYIVAFIILLIGYIIGKFIL